MHDGDSPHAHVQAYCAFASGKPPTFANVNTNLSSLLPEFEEHNIPRDRQTAQTGQSLGPFNKRLRWDQSYLRRKVGQLLNTGNAGIRQAIRCHLARL